MQRIIDDGRFTDEESFMSSELKVRIDMSSKYFFRILPKTFVCKSLPLDVVASRSSFENTPENFGNRFIY